MENKDDFDKAIEELEKAHKSGNIKDVKFYSQYLDIKLKNQQNQLNKIAIENLNKISDLIAGLKKEIESSTDRINNSNKILSDQQSGQNKWMLFWTAIVAVTSIFASITSWNSAKSANLSVIQAENTAKAQLRPYLLIELVKNQLPWDGKAKIVLPVNLRNIGQTPALKILKGYNSFLLDKSGVNILVQPFRERAGEEDSLSPTQISAKHMLDINITGFNLEKNLAIKVELLISYEGFHEIDSKRYFSKSIYIMTPRKTANGTVVFIVSQPKLAFGYAEDGWDYK